LSPECRGSNREEDVDVEADELSRQSWKALGFAIREPRLELDRPAEVREAGAEWHECGPVLAWVEDADSVEFRRLLRLAGERSGEQCCEARDECAALHHSITWSARSSSDGGMVRPSARAVFRLNAKTLQRTAK